MDGRGWARRVTDRLDDMEPEQPSTSQSVRPAVRALTVMLLSRRLKEPLSQGISC
jgi:hypothetical protein